MQKYKPMTTSKPFNRTFFFRKKKRGMNETGNFSFILLSNSVLNFCTSLNIWVVLTP